MKIIKRNGAEVVFDIEKIRTAVTKANEAVEESARMTALQISRIAESVQIACEEMGRSPSVEEIQDLVEKSIMAHGAFEVASSSATTKRSNRKMPTKTPPSTLCSVTTWQARFPRISPAVFCCPRRLWMPTTPVLSISTIPTILLSICTTAIW